MFIVSGLSMLLVVYVGYGEAQRTYNQFQVEKLEAQGKILHIAMGTYLSTGLPLKQYVGFKTRAEAILASDSTISALHVFDPNGRIIFAAGDNEIPLLVPEPGDSESDDGTLDLRQNDEFLQVVFPLRNKFETVGSLAVTMPRATVRGRLDKSFSAILIVAGCLALGFALFTASVGPRLARQRTPWLQIVYALTFLAMSGVVVGTLISIYTEGAQAKTKALTDSLGQRVRDIVDFNLNIDGFEGLDQVFRDYRRLNSDISAAGLTVNGKVVIHTDPLAVGAAWDMDPRTYEYIIDLTRPEKNANEVKIAVVMPTVTVYRQVARSVKNFAALFVATAFLAGLFLQVGRSVQQLQTSTGTCGDDPDCPEYTDSQLSLVKPVFFIAVFAENLTYSFLPQFMQQLVTDAGLSAGYVSAPFMVFYLCFALTLIPAGHYARHVGARRLTYLGLIIAAISLLSLAVLDDFFLVVLARAAAGVGQGMLFIGIQCYILAKASPGKKTQGAAIIVYGFQGGMISGMAIGSLLVTYMGAHAVFTLSGIIASAATLYTMMFVPHTAYQTLSDNGIGATFRRLRIDMGHVLRNPEFLRTMFLIGIPAKAVMTGVIIFALPLLLAGKQFAQEDIGQIIMLYAIGVLVASTYVSRVVDRIGKTDGILFWGAAISGIGLLLIGTSGWQRFAEIPNGETLSNLVMIAGVLTVGIAHGFVNAPVVTRVAESALAARIGANTATATYRFLERVGHIAGPILVAQLFVFVGQNVVVGGWLGGAILLFGLIFILSCTSTPSESKEHKTIQERELDATTP